MVIATTGVNTTTNVFTSTAHGLVNGAELNYNNQGGTTITGLTSGTDYFVVNKTTDTFQLALTSGGAAIDISGTGNNSQTFASTGNYAQYFDLMTATTATAVAAKGTGATGTSAAHSGWVQRTVGTGAHAGRVKYEVLVALSKNAIASSDAADDIEFPDA
jgi:hypothetical protein